jgi:Recombinase/Resolvase, N terminal domain
LAHFGLILDQSIIDRAMSATNGLHRTKGNLSILLKTVRAGNIKRGTVLIVEKIDRLFREGILDVFPVLSEMIKAGLVIVTGHDFTIYCEAAINGDLAHKLVAELQAASIYTRNLTLNALGASQRRRIALEALADNPDAPRPRLNGTPPAWLERVGKVDYAEHPIHAQTVRLIFGWCIAGHSVTKIAERLNREKIGLFPQGRRTPDEWCGSAVGMLLRNEAVLGFYQPHRREGTGRIAVGQPVKLYPQVIDADTWIKARDALGVRYRNMRGRRGDDVPNLFGGGARCKTCDAVMRVDTSGRIKNGQRPRRFVCSRWKESRTCADNTMYNFHHFEEPILLNLIDAIAPTLSRATNAQKLIEEHAALKLDMIRLDTGVATLAPMIGTSPSLAQTVVKMGLERDVKAEAVRALEIQIEAVNAPSKRHRDVGKAIGELIVPARLGDVEARSRLRALVAGIDFKVVGHPVIDGMLVTVAGRDYDIYPPSLPTDTALDRVRGVDAADPL